MVKKLTYEEQLLTPEWKEKRSQIIYRDLGMCQHCMSTKNLQVHHKYYIEGRMAWEYPDIALLTLCENCHKNTHKRPLKGYTALDIALDRLVTVASGVRSWCVGQLRKDNGEKTL